MKKTLIALALAASAVSGSVMAWTTGDLNGSIDIGGTVTPTPVSPWQWKMGANIASLNADTTAMTEANAVTITVTTPAPIVMGKMVNPTVGGPGLAPQITWADIDNNAVSINFKGGSDGSGSLTLPMVAQDGTTKLGSVVLNTHSYGLMANSNPATGAGLNFQPLQASNAGDAGLGLLGTNSDQLQGADVTIAAMNTLAKEEIFSAVMKQGATAKDQAASSQLTSNAYKNTAAMVMGFNVGDSVVVTFNTKPTTATVWKAPLKVTVTNI